MNGGLGDPAPSPPCFVRSAWGFASREDSKRKTLTKADVQRAAATHAPWDFLVEIVGRPGAAPSQPSIADI